MKNGNAVLQVIDDGVGMDQELWITFTKDIRWIITPTVLGYIMSRKDFSFIMGTSMELFMKANQVKELLPQLQYRDNRRGCDEKVWKMDCCGIASQPGIFCGSGKLS